MLVTGQDLRALPLLGHDFGNDLSATTFKEITKIIV
jgi:hypothetical protein